MFSDDLFDVRAARVYHGSVPAAGFRIRTPDVDVVLSGDRGATWQESFVAFAKGTDLLVHEIIDIDLVKKLLKDADSEFIEHLANDHSDGETVGTAATGAGVPTLLLYHLVPGNQAITDKHWKDLVSPYFSGEIIVASDLLVV